MREGVKVRVKVMHRYAWLWEPLEPEASFVLRAMFGAKSVYLDGKLMLCFISKTEPWRGVLVCTDRSYQESLINEFPALRPHAVLPKWLYLPEIADSFERDAERIVKLVQRRDARIGVVAKSKKQRIVESNAQLEKHRSRSGKKGPKRLPAKAKKAT